MLRLEGVGKRYGERWALRDACLTLDDQKFVVLLGPSGAGKSTIVRLIAGVETPDEGRITLDGQDIAPSPPEIRPVATVWQSLNLFPHLNVVDNIAFGLRSRGWSRRSARAKATELLDSVGLEGFEMRPVSSLSGGEQQRVALVRSLAVQPRFLLLDEPLGAIDEQLRYDLARLLRRVHKSSPRGFLMVTHRIEEALACADYLAVMFDGHIDAEDSPAAVYFRPSTSRVADFIGRNNVLAVKFAKVNDELCLAETDIGVLAASSWAPPSDSSEPGFYCVRPKHLRLLRSGYSAEHSANMVEGTLEEIWYEGGFVRLYASVNSSRLEAELPTAELSRQRLEVGAPIQLCWDAANAFCRASGLPGESDRGVSQSSLGVTRL